MQNSITWAALGAGVSIIVGMVTLAQFVLEPLATRVETARDNIRGAFAERDARMDYLQRQIDELERQFEP